VDSKFPIHSLALLAHADGEYMPVTGPKIALQLRAEEALPFVKGNSLAGAAEFSGGGSAEVGSLLPMEGLEELLGAVSSLCAPKVDVISATSREGGEGLGRRQGAKALELAADAVGQATGCPASTPVEGDQVDERHQASVGPDGGGKGRGPE
jgi:hypothetical protein